MAVSPTRRPRHPQPADRPAARGLTPWPVVLGLIGVTAHDLLYLLFIGIIVLVTALALGGARLRKTGHRTVR
ncbi:hypothetical protein BX265_7485 [Streptomyces sp. TLI_235]|nr:hypothetical protein BX265_7485 [Streptomyces sp. TLI_235]